MHDSLAALTHTATSTRAASSLSAIEASTSSAGPHIPGQSGRRGIPAQEGIAGVDLDPLTEPTDPLRLVFPVDLRQLVRQQAAAAMSTAALSRYPMEVANTGAAPPRVSCRAERTRVISRVLPARTPNRPRRAASGPG